MCIHVHMYTHSALLRGINSIYMLCVSIPLPCAKMPRLAQRDCRAKQRFSPESRLGRHCKSLEMPGIEPGASHMQSERSTAELHPLHAGFHKT